MSETPSFNDDKRHRVVALVEEQQTRLFWHLKRYLKDDNTCWDLVQDVFVLVLLKWHQYDEARPFWPWLCTIANRHLATKARSPWARRNTGSPDALEGLEAAGPSALESLIDAEERDEMRKRIDRLPAIYGKTIRPMYFEGLSNSEIAKALNVPIGTVNSRKHEALQRLKQEAGPDHEDS